MALPIQAPSTTRRNEDAPMPILVLATKSYKNKLKSEAASHELNLSEYNRRVLDIGRKAVEANPDLLKEE